MRNNRNYIMIKGIAIILGLSLGGIGIAGISASGNKPEIIASSIKTPKTAKPATADSSHQAVSVAERFMAGYIEDSVPLDKWLASAPVTENFRKNFKEAVKALSLKEDLLNEKIKESNLSKADRELLKKYSNIEYDVLLGASAYDTNPGYSYFKMKSWNERTGIMVLKDEIDTQYAVHSEGVPLRSEIKMKMVYSNGRWLVDGAGFVNMK